MLSRELGFFTSWKMLTHERGWMVPLCLLALVGWIPILGQIVVLGYAYEWARFTAWGVDTAPKRRDVDFGKVLGTGLRAFLILFLMGTVVHIALALLGLGGLDRLVRFLPMNMGFSISTVVDGVTELSLWGILALAVGFVLGTFLMAAMMRATLYDSFSAGWRIDRLFQMIGRDPAGFFRVWLISLAGGAIGVAYALICTAVGGALALGGFVAYARHGGVSYHLGHEGLFLEHLASWGMGPIIFAFLLLVAAVFLYGVLSIAMQMVAVNAMGQWFCRFEVDRWGVSAAPLPDGVPVRAQDSASPAAGGSAPVPPRTGADAAPSASGGQSSSSDGSYWDDDAPAAR